MFHYSLSPFYCIVIQFLILFISNTNHLSNDCHSAINICELRDYHFELDKGVGLKENLFLSDNGFNETNSVWLKFEAESAGNLEFIIFPDSPQDDLDFILYKSSAIDKCSDLNPIRIMTSGFIVGDNDSHCLGNTGLKYGQTDVNESSGCNKFKDKFLAPLALETKGAYYLLINNFNSSLGFTILLSGDETLGLKNSCNDNDVGLDFMIFPNPADHSISIKPIYDFYETTIVEIVDVLGRIHSNAIIESFTEAYTIDVNELLPANYYVRITSNESISIKSFIKR